MKATHMRPTNRWIILLLSFLVNLSSGFALQSIPPLLPSLIAEFQVSHAMAGSLMSFVALPGLLLAIPAGALAARYGAKAIGTAGLLIAALGAMLSALSPSFPVLQLSRLIVGIGWPLSWVAALSLIPQWFSKEERGLAMGFMAMGMPTAVAAAFNILGRVEVSYDWRVSLWITFGVSLAVLLAFLFFAREKPGERATLSFSGLRNAQIWVLGLIWAFFNVAVVSFSTWGKTLFIEFRGLEPAYADFVASLIIAVGFATPLTGLLADILKRRKLLLIIGALYMIMAFPFIPYFSGPLLACFVAALGLMTLLIPPTLFALPPVIMGPRDAPLGFGVLHTCLSAAIITGPFLTGLVIDTAHNFTFPVLAMSFFSLIALILSLMLRTR